MLCTPHRFLHMLCWLACCPAVFGGSPLKVVGQTSFGSHFLGVIIATGKPPQKSYSTGGPHYVTWHGLQQCSETGSVLCAAQILELDPGNSLASSTVQRLTSVVDERREKMKEEMLGEAAPHEDSWEAE